MFFFKPQYAKDAEQLNSYAQKLLKYKEDILPETVKEEIQATMRAVEEAVKAKNEPQANELMKKLSTLLERQSPPRKELGWRENVEVFVVAFVVAAGIRAYILQPFKIPTGSMQPTLNGIIVTPQDRPNPNFIQRGVELALLGRTYFSVESAEDDRLMRVESIKIGRWTDGTRLTTRKGQTFLVPAPPNPLCEAYGIDPRTLDFTIKAGVPFMRGYATLGDHVFVDKVTYNFRIPKRDDVFVFLTKDIRAIEGQPGHGQFYIKRLVGLPGDRLRLEPPALKINGAIPELPGIKRVISAEKGYRGYTFPYGGPFGRPLDPSESTYGSTVMIGVDGGFEHVVGPDHFFAMGDNSHNSWDSRNWGDIPEQNAVGRGVFVWWPFGPHWGFVR